MTRGLHQSELVGRATHLAEVRRFVAEAARSRGTTLLVTGEAGVGKSRLLREAAASARAAGLVVLRGAAVEGGGAFRPLSEALLGRLRDDDLAESADLRPFRSALARILPGWAGVNGDIESSVDPVVILGEGVLRLLRQIGGETGCVLMLDDLHWADSDTVALVEFLAGVVAASRVLVVVAARTDEPLDDRLRRLQRHDGVAVLKLSRLDADDVHGLATSCMDGAIVPDAVHQFLFERSEGLPLVALELLDGLVESGVLVSTPEGWELRGGSRSPTCRRRWPISSPAGSVHSHRRNASSSMPPP